MIEKVVLLSKELISRLVDETILNILDRTFDINRWANHWYIHTNLQRIHNIDTYVAIGLPPLEGCNPTDLSKQRLLNSVLTIYLFKNVEGPIRPHQTPSNPTKPYLTSSCPTSLPNQPTAQLLPEFHLKVSKNLRRNFSWNSIAQKRKKILP